ncbi:hypothetical protein GYH30_005551 [Glycine max]|nr:hypothetical protein GYH30_005551 [Glycine max]
MGLTKLFLDKCNFDFDYFRVKAPNLKIFKYCGWINFAVVEIDSLAMEEVDLDFSLESSFEEFGHPIYNLVKDVCTARVLTVCSFVLQVIPTGPEQLRMEVDMDARHLIMKTALDDDEFIGISFFLNSCPLLERLTIEIGPKSELSDYEPAFEFTSLLFWIEYLNVCECLISSLEVVEINGFRGTLNEYRFLEYLIFSGFSMPGNHDSDIIDQCNENNIYYGDYDEALFELPEQVYQHEVSLGWIEVRLSAIKALLSNYNMLESLSFKRCWNLEKFDLGEEQHTEENLNFSLEYGFEGLGHPLYNTVISTGLELLGFQSDDMLVQHLIMKTYGFAQEQVLGNHILPQKLPNVPKKIRL